MDRRGIVRVRAILVCLCARVIVRGEERSMVRGEEGHDLSLSLSPSLPETERVSEWYVCACLIVRGVVYTHPPNWYVVCGQWAITDKAMHTHAWTHFVSCCRPEVSAILTEARQVSF